MSDFLSFLGRLFSLLWEWFVSVLENIYLALDVAGASIVQAFSFPQYLPAIFGASVTVCIGIYVVKFLLGR